MNEKELMKMDFKEVLNLCLKQIEDYNKTLSFKELIEEYYDYYDFYIDEDEKGFYRTFEDDDEKEYLDYNKFFELCLDEEYNYKSEYSKEELIDFLINKEL